MGRASNTASSSRFQHINEAGGVLGRLVEAFYGDNAADPATGIAATKRLIEEQRVPVLLGGIMPTQRSFFAYEATNLVVDAIRRANSDKPDDIERALKTTTMPSLLGGTYAMDDHNHPHTPMQIVGARNGKPSVIAQVGG